MQEERNQWETEKEQYQERDAWFEKELARLQEENNKLRLEPPAPVPAPVEVSAPVQAHHEQQLKLMQTIDVLRRELDAERQQREQLQQAAKTVGACGKERLVPSQLDQTLAAACRPIPEPEEFENLEDENLKLREELNASKAKVIELKQAAAKRAADWRSEMKTIAEELATKESLEQEAATLRKDRMQLQEELTKVQNQLNRHEAVAKAEIERLREELLEAQKQIRENGAMGMKAEEMDRMSSTLTHRINELEQELARRVGDQTHLLSLFLKHAEQPVEALRVHCKRICSSGTEIPYSFVPDPNDIQNSLVNIIDMLRWAEEVTEAYEDPRKRRSQLLA